MIRPELDQHEARAVIDALRADAYSAEAIERSEAAVYLRRLANRLERELLRAHPLVFRSARRGLARVSDRVIAFISSYHQASA